MKNIRKGILAICAAAVMAFSMTACTQKAESAYDIAVKNGFVGTEQEWLQSLHGANGEDADDITAKDLYDTAVVNGFKGTFLDFCKEMNLETSTGHNTSQIANNIMSVVGIYCGFTSTQTTNGWPRPSTTTTPSMSMGSGVIVDLDKENGNALIITNYHVIYNQESDQANGISKDIYLYLYGAANHFAYSETDGWSDVGSDAMRARVIGGAMDYDIAVLKVEGNEYLKNSAATEAKIGNSDNMRQGEDVFAIGNPEGEGISVTHGILSTTSEYISMYALDNRDANRDGEVDSVSFRVMRTEAAINGGNSGGGLFNGHGELVGIVNAKSTGEDMDNMGYALPTAQVKAVYDNLMDNNGVVKRATLGVMVSVQSSVASFNEKGTLDVTETFVVAEEAAHGSAAYGKLRYGDVFKTVQIKKAGGTVGEKITLTRQYQLNDLLLTVRKGDTVILGMERQTVAATENVTVEVPFNQNTYFVQF